MIVSHEHQFVFIHIPRTGGTRISKDLCKAIGIENWRSFIGEPKKVALKDHNNENVLYDKDYVRKFEARKHITAAKLRKIIGREKWRDYFKFSLVRNPWDRTLSTYLHRRKIAPNVIKWFWPKNSSLFQMSLKLKYKILKRKSVQQVDMLTDDNDNIIVDYVGRYEDIEKDFDKICNIIGVDAELGGKYDSTKSTHYSEYYDEKSRNIVKDVNEKDIRVFGYKFEG